MCNINLGLQLLTRTQKLSPVSPTDFIISKLHHNQILSHKQSD